MTLRAYSSPHSLLYLHTLQLSPPEATLILNLFPLSQGLDADMFDSARPLDEAELQAFSAMAASYSSEEGGAASTSEGKKLRRATVSG